MFLKRLCMPAAISAALALTTPASFAGAADIQTTHRLASALANDLAVAAVAACDKMGYQTSAAVVDIDGVDQSMVRGDGGGIHTLASAHDKAYSAVTFGVDTITMVERAKTGTAPVAIFNKLPHLMLADGGLVIKVNNEILAGIGVAGSPGKDTDCAKAALDKYAARLK